MKTTKNTVKATTQNLERFNVVRLPYGDQHVLKLSVVKSVDNKNNEVTVVKMYDCSTGKQEQTYKVSSLDKWIGKVDLTKFASVVWNM